ncbi:MAG: TIGR00303 family protein [Thermoplasmatales archaeon]|nr:TIGR00303 family protein [Thermoplasmatales archaeon]
MSFELPESLGIAGNEGIAKDILSGIWGGRGTFTCTIANTMTSTIPGVSDAGDTPELTLYTPPADAEMLMVGKTLCMDGIPINPGGIPTPATLTMAALRISGMPVHIINAGCKVMPKVPCYDVGGGFGRSILTGDSVTDPEGLYEAGVTLGRAFARRNDFLVVSESCAGGTTTALAVMMAMGVIKENMVSSSSPNNPKELKTRLVGEALDAAGVSPGDLADDPLEAIRCVGDPMMPVNAGMIAGATETVPVIVGGGTQMSAVIAAAVAMDPSCVGKTVHGTTRWMVNDKNSDIVGIMRHITEDIPLVYVNMDYSGSPHDGLRAYERGYIKEGVGCGGASLACIVESSGKVTCDDLLEGVHSIYADLMGF